MVRKNVFFPYYTILIDGQVKKYLLFYLEPILIKKLFFKLATVGEPFLHLKLK